MFRWLIGWGIYTGEDVMTKWKTWIVVRLICAPALGAEAAAGVEWVVWEGFRAFDRSVRDLSPGAL